MQVSTGELRPGIVVHGRLVPEPVGLLVGHPMGTESRFTGADDAANSNLTAILQQHGLEKVNSL